MGSENYIEGPIKEAPYHHSYGTTADKFFKHYHYRIKQALDSDDNKATDEARESLNRLLRYIDKPKIRELRIKYFD